MPPLVVGFDLDMTMIDPRSGIAGEPTALLPGAREAVEAVHRHGGRVVVVTAKGDAPLEHGATVYVGDREADMAGAQLRAAGADVVLTDLRDFPAWLDEHVLATRLADLDTALRGLGSVLVAFSGGADSAFLLAAAVRALGTDRVVAATAVSGSLPGTELAPAAAFAADLGVRHLTPGTAELERDGYRTNAGDRCYFCKAELLDVLTPLAAEHGVDHVATGTNADDALAGFRPGMRAAAQRRAVTPLLDAGLTKDQVRAASRRWGLVTWDKPAAACLSSRVAFGIEITPARLVRVEQAEAGVRHALAVAGIAVENVRVRDLGGSARLEVDPARVPEVAASQRVADAVLTAGFDRVEVDPRGFRSGSMNELLADPDRYR